MKPLVVFCTLALATVPVWTQQAAPSPNSLSATSQAVLGLFNERSPLPGVVTGGAPDVGVLERAVAAGFKTLIELRSEAERDLELEAKAQQLGLEVHRIPIGGPDDLDIEATRELAEILKGGRPLLLTCASGNRSGALLALEAAWVDGVAAEEALALGKAAGLTRLEPVVREKLGLPPATPPN